MHLKNTGSRMSVRFPRQSRICRFCGNIFLAKSNARKNGFALFCNRACMVGWHASDAYFWERFDRTGECWVWMHAKNAAGYGQVRCNGGKRVLTHRAAWEKVNGPIPAGLQVLHKCDNPPCGRPDHLFLGTAKDNVQDMLAKGRCRSTGRPYNRVSLVCKACGGAFTMQLSQQKVSPGRGTFCSDACRSVFDRSPEHFWERFSKFQDCWVWQGADNGRGYGAVRYDDRVMTVHRLAWELTYGPIPGKLNVRQRCKNRRCGNPAHLYLAEHSQAAAVS